MNAQVSLFDTPLEGHLPVRADDPATARVAARDLQGRVKERKREVIAALEALGVPSPASVIKVEMARQGVIRELGPIRSRLAQLEHDAITRTAGVIVMSKDDGGTGRPEQRWMLRAWDERS